MFKIGDILIYFLLMLLLIILIHITLNIKELQGSKAEIYVNNKLTFVENLKKERKNIFVPTELGGINVEFINNKVRVTSSNSPKKIIVKQGFIWKSGETLIGVPDKVLIKIVGDSDLDYIVK